jgi:chaperonin GroEL (HSP60 family)
MQLRSEHEKGKSTYGIDVLDSKISDMDSLGVVEPLKLKLQVIKSATEAAEMILRIDDVITAKSGGAGMPPGGMGGMPPGGMGGEDMD